MNNINLVFDPNSNRDMTYNITKNTKISKKNTRHSCTAKIQLDHGQILWIYESYCISNYVCIYEYIDIKTVDQSTII